MKKLAGYIRVSTVMQAKDGESLETQEEEIIALAKQREQKYEIYKDKGASAGSTNRPELQRLMEDSTPRLRVRIWQFKADVLD